MCCLGHVASPSREKRDGGKECGYGKRERNKGYWSPEMWLSAGDGGRTILEICFHCPEHEGAGTVISS